MLRPFQSQSSYVLALSPFTRHIGTIAASNRNLSMTAYKHGSGGVKPKIPEGERGPNEHEHRTEARVEARPGPGSNKELQRLDNWWLKYSQEREQQQEQELQRKTAEIQNLTAALMREKSEKGRVEGRMKIYWAIEDILWQSKEAGMVCFDINEEEALYELMEYQEFTEIIQKEAQARGLVLEDVADCAKSIYFDLLPPGCGRDHDREETFAIRDTDFTEKERAALITFMKVQSKWPHALRWREDVSGKAGEGNVQGCQ